MLQDFLVANRSEIIERVQRRAQARRGSESGGVELQRGVPILLTQIAAALAEANTLRARGAQASTTKIGETAAQHGHQLLRAGLSVAEAVNSYGDVCQVVTQLAVEADAAISVREFHVLNECLDEAIAGAVSAYASQRERDLVYQGSERLGILAHEMRNLLNTMTLSFAIVRQGKVGLGGSTGAMLARSMSGLSALVDRSVAEARSVAGASKLEAISMVEFMKEMQVSGAAHADGYGLQLTVHPVDRDLVIDGDWQLLASAVSNLLQNAFKFSRPGGRVSLAARVSGDRVLIEVCDECGGLPEGETERLFRPPAQVGSVRSGAGLGLSIARSAVHANNGEIHVRDIPGTGCVFSIELRRRPEADPSAIAV
jgi:signal transduction histidine kinase